MSVFVAKRPLIMGVLNTTPDSFSDGGQYITPKKALEHALSLIDEGADIIDVGGESTRPQAVAVDVSEEINRVVPIIKALRLENPTIAISIDTSKPQVMQAAVAAGATIINDVKALQAPNALQMAADLQVPVCLMHMQGTPQTMQQAPTYADVVSEVKTMLSQRVEIAKASGIQDISIDLGFGFGKNLSHNVELFQHIGEFKTLGLPIVVGVSRKRMIAEIIQQQGLEQRDMGSACAALLAVQKGADVVRVHNVAMTKYALQMHQVLA